MRKKTVREILEQEHGYRFDGNGMPSEVPLAMVETDGEPEVDETVPASAVAAARRMDSLRTMGRVPRERRYPWSVMQHGQSFVVATMAERRAARTSLLAYMKTKRCHLHGDHYMVSKSLGRGEGYRCWLISADELPLASRQAPRGAAPSVEDDHPIPGVED